MMRLPLFAVLALMCSAASFTQAAGDPEAGRSAYTTCAACHGAQGEGNAQLKAPRLTHLEPVYIVAQLDKFKSGVRGGEGASQSAVQMAGMAATLPDAAAMDNVAAYIATLPQAKPSTSVEGDVTMGGDYYNQFCGACHGAAAQGNPALNSPRLAGADDWYLVAQLQAFRDGSRGSHPEDRTGRQMRAMAGILPTEQAVKDVVAFIRSQPR